MTTNRRNALAALLAAGVLWGTTVPLTKYALDVLPPAWLTVARFLMAGAVLAAVARPSLRQSVTPSLLVWGAVGYGGTIVVQNAGLARTSVSHAALLIGAMPVLVAVIASLAGRTRTRALGWAGFATSLSGVAMIAASGGGDATVAGDALVLGSVAVGATFTVAQARLLPGRDPVAVSTAQFLVAGVAALPVALITEGLPARQALAATSGELIAVLAMATIGTVLPFTLFAYGQGHVPAPTAGAFLNVEAVVGAAIGAAVFGDTVGLPQVAGGVAVLAGIALSTGRVERTSAPPAARGEQPHGRGEADRLRPAAHAR